MLDVPLPLQALQDGLTHRWTRVWPTPGRTLPVEGAWTQASGLSLEVQPGTWRSWHLVLSIGSKSLPVSLPRTQRVHLGTNIAPLHDDIARWLPSLDLDARHRLAHTLGTWLVRHGRTEHQRIQLGRDPNKILVSQWKGGDWDRICVPQVLLAAMEPDLNLFWEQEPTPSCQGNTGGYGSWSFHALAKTGNRDFNLDLPTTAHGRLQLMSEVPPHLRDMPLTDPD